MMDNLIASSFVPNEKIRRQRQYNRRIFDLNTVICRKLVKIFQCLQRCNSRINNYVPTTYSKDYCSVIKLIAEGITDANLLVTKIHDRTINRHGRGTLRKALTGVVNIAEASTDMSHFQTPKKLVSRVGLSPRNEESAGKIKSLRITHGNKFLRKTLSECSWGASRTRGSFFSEFSYRQCVERRKNEMKVRSRKHVKYSSACGTSYMTGWHTSDLRLHTFFIVAKEFATL